MQGGEEEEQENEDEDEEEATFPPNKASSGRLQPAISKRRPLSSSSSSSSSSSAASAIPSRGSGGRGGGKKASQQEKKLAPLLSAADAYKRGIKQKDIPKDQDLKVRCSSCMHARCLLRVCVCCICCSCRSNTLLIASPSLLSTFILLSSTSLPPTGDLPRPPRASHLHGRPAASLPGLLFLLLLLFFFFFFTAALHVHAVARALPRVPLRPARGDRHGVHHAATRGRLPLRHCGLGLFFFLVFLLEQESG